MIDFFEYFSNLKSRKFKGKLGLGMIIWRKVRVNRWVFDKFKKYSKKSIISVPGYTQKLSNKYVLIQKYYRLSTIVIICCFWENTRKKIFFALRTWPKTHFLGLKVCEGFFNTRFYLRSNNCFSTKEANFYKTSLNWWHQKIPKFISITTIYIYIYIY